MTRLCHLLCSFQFSIDQGGALIPIYPSAAFDHTHHTKTQSPPSLQTHPPLLLPRPTFKIFTCSSDQPSLPRAVVPCLNQGSRQPCHSIARPLQPIDRWITGPELVNPGPTATGRPKLAPRRPWPRPRARPTPIQDAAAAATDEINGTDNTTPILDIADTASELAPVAETPILDTAAGLAERATATTPAQGVGSSQSHPETRDENHPSNRPKAERFDPST